MATPYDQPLSSVTWGTRYTSPTDTGPATQNAADWDAARAAYVDALTKPTAAEREAALADTFLKLVIGDAALSVISR